MTHLPITMITSDTDLSELAKPRRLTILLGTCGCGKSEATNIILSAASKAGQRSKVVEGGILVANEVMDANIRDVANELDVGDVLVIRDHLHPELTPLIALADENNIRVVIELQTYPAHPDSAMGLNADWFAMRCVLSNVAALMPLIGGEFAEMLGDFREGQAIQFSHTQRPRLVRFERGE